jgi:polysaccharide biosynthesis/export protein
MRLLGTGVSKMKRLSITQAFLLVAALVCFAVASVSAQKRESKSSGSASAQAAEAKAAANPTEDSSNDAESTQAAIDEVLPYYTNYLKEYRLGPNDMISVEVFGQCPDYCKTGITIPPTARISYPLIREGVLVAGKTVEQVASEITKKLDEYIIDPKVTVTLDKAMSVRYAVMGKVGTPGVRVMDRKISVYEAIIDAGGVAKGGDRKKAYIISYNKAGRLEKRQVSLADMEAGRAEMVYLSPGDQVFVPGKGFSVESVFDALGKASAVRLLFGSPF